MSIVRIKSGEVTRWVLPQFVSVPRSSYALSCNSQTLCKASTPDIRIGCTNFTAMDANSWFGAKFPSQVKSVEFVVVRGLRRAGGRISTSSTKEHR